MHNIALMPSRLILAFAFSLALHGSLFVADAFKHLSAEVPRPALQAKLRQPPERDRPPADPLLKNTLEAEAPPRAAAPPPPMKSAKPGRRSVEQRTVGAAQKKLSKHLYYPPEAVSRGIEGDVHLLLTLATGGNIIDVHVAASSGHAVLDNAAVKAAYAMGAIGETEARELILPVIFRLQ